MALRHHPLTLGEKVFDYDTHLIYHITAINPDGTIDLFMTDADIKENKLMFDCEITEDEYERQSDNPNALYQFTISPLVGRDGNRICYEHTKTEDKYPYFSPYLDENLFTFETWFIEDWEKEFGTILE